MLIDSRKMFQYLLVVALCAGTAAAATKPQTFSVPQTWHVPAATLQPGSYSIRVLDQMADRTIVKIESADGSVHSTFIAIPNPKIPAPGQAGPVMWQGKSDEAYVRGWKFPGASTVLEFAYPKADAVSIARREQSAVPAVDPDSEGMKAVPNALASKSDMEVINLWLLSAKQVGPDPEKAEIKAARYQAGASPVEPKHVAVLTATKLPKTASEMPLILLVMGVSFALAFSIRAVRQLRTQVRDKA